MGSRVLECGRVARALALVLDPTVGDVMIRDDLSPE